MVLRFHYTILKLLLVAERCVSAKLMAIYEQPFLQARHLLACDLQGSMGSQRIEQFCYCSGQVGMLVPFYWSEAEEERRQMAFQWVLKHIPFIERFYLGLLGQDILPTQFKHKLYLLIETHFEFSGHPITQVYITMTLFLAQIASYFFGASCKL